MSITVPSAPSSSISISYESNYAIVAMKREPVNSMNLEVWAGLNHALETVEADPKMRGIIFTSALTRDVFTAGNDINELYSKNTSGDRYIQFWRAQTYFLSRLYQSRLLTIAVIPGQCPAGGCAVAMVCDVRFMANDGNYRIGLNEVALGIPVPLYWGRLLVKLVGQSLGEEMLLNAVMLSTNEAKSSGLIHYAMPKAELMEAAKKEMTKRLKYADSGRIATKMQLRSEFSKAWQNYCQKEAEEGWKMLASPKTTAALGAVLQRLQGGVPKTKTEQTKSKL